MQHVLIVQLAKHVQSIDLKMVHFARAMFNYLNIQQIKIVLIVIILVEHVRLNLFVVYVMVRIIGNFLQQMLLLYVFVLQDIMMTILHNYAMLANILAKLVRVIVIV